MSQEIFIRSKHQFVRQMSCIIDDYLETYSEDNVDDNIYELYDSNMLDQVHKLIESQDQLFMEQMFYVKTNRETINAT